MSEQGEKLKKNFLDQWIRLVFVVLYIIVFGLLWRFIAGLMLVVIILQSLHRVIAVENNNTLLTFSEGLGNFLLKVLNYVLYLSDEKPIDFDSFFGQIKDTSHSSEESAAKPENVAAEPELLPEEDVVESSADTSLKSGNSVDDVFADISFTENTNDSSGDGKGESE